MRISDMITRPSHPTPWAEGEKIPWHDPDFSRRMLDFHLAQENDAASRRSALIEQHIEWIHHEILHETPTRILDLGCGPGLYTERLAQLGHECVGIDFAPAAIAYARDQAKQSGSNCTYYQGDLRTTDFGSGYGLAMSIFGEFNVFRPSEARSIVSRAFQALLPGGTLLFEPHTFDFVKRLGETPARWHSEVSGLFSEQPHLYLQEYFWDPAAKVTTQRYFIIDAESAAVEFHASSMQAYTDEDYSALLVDCGYKDVRFYSSLAGSPAAPQEPLIAIVAHRS